MSEETASAESVPLQFDRAEPTGRPAAGLACSRCGREIGATYFDVNGAVTCPACRVVLEGERRRGGAGRLLRAGAFGLGAAALGSGLYYAVAALTGYEFGLIGIAVGFGVGVAVRAGSRGRGGAGYQALAIALTYLAIVSSYVPSLVRSFEQRAAARRAEASGAKPPWAVPSGAAATAPAGEPEGAPPTRGELAVALLTLAGIVLALPFLAGFENIMGIAIIGFSLYEAWKLNRAAPFTVSGPLDARSRGAPVGDVAA
jgi:hypothetical protein